MKNIEPYRPLFFMGVLQALVGAGIWLVISLTNIEKYPNEAHGLFMITGFLMSFVCGFLMTAIPKMTQTHAASPTEVLFVTLLSILQTSFFLATNVLVIKIIFFLQLFTLMVFIVRRFFKRKQNPPNTFIFVAFGFVMLILGLTFNIKIFIYEAFLLNLILGIGSRLVPVITKATDFSQLLTNHQSVGANAILALFFNASFVLEYLGFYTYGTFMRAIVVTVLCFKNFNLIKETSDKTLLALSIRISCWAILLSSWVLPFFQNFRFHIQHILYIAGFALMTVMIASRVIIAHGGYDFIIEKKMRCIIVAAVLFIVTASIRVYSVFFAEKYLFLIGVASFFWILSILTWSFGLLPKLLNLKSASQC